MTGKVTRAVRERSLVITEPGETPTSEMPALSQAGRMPGAVVQVNVPVAGSSLADTAWGAAVMVTSAASAAAVMVRRMGTPAVGEVDAGNRAATCRSSDRITAW